MIAGIVGCCTVCAVVYVLVKVKRGLF